MHHSHRTLWPHCNEATTPRPSEPQAPARGVHHALPSRHQAPVRYTRRPRFGLENRKRGSGVSPSLLGTVVLGLIACGILATAGCNPNDANRHAAGESDAALPDASHGRAEDVVVGRPTSQQHADAVAAPHENAHADGRPRVRIETTLGDIVVELYPEKAPKTVENFLQYVEDGFYEGTVVHSIIRGMLIKGGEKTADYKVKTEGLRDPIELESQISLKNERGTIAIDRVLRPDTAKARFFINVVDNPKLDYRGPTPAGWGFAAFGRVVQGMDVVDRIHDTELMIHPQQGRANMRQPKTPVEPVIIESMRRIDTDNNERDP